MKLSRLLLLSLCIPSYGDHHDEPIIIENGPVRICLNPFNNPNSTSSLIGSRSVVRSPSGPIARLRFWKSGQEILCDGGPCDVDGESTAMTATLMNDDSLSVRWTKEEHGALLLSSDTDLAEVSGTAGHVRTKADLLVKSVTFTSPGGTSRSVSLRRSTDDKASVRIQLCARGGKCPNYAEASCPLE